MCFLKKLFINSTFTLKKVHQYYNHCRKVWCHLQTREELTWNITEDHYFNPVTNGPLCPPLTHGPQADLPYKNRADLPEGRELRATVIAALSLRVS